MNEKINRYFQILRIKIALMEKYKAKDPWKCNATKTIILPIRIEAPSTTLWGRAMQRIRKAAGRVYFLAGESVYPNKLGKEASEIFDSFCTPATYNIVPTEEIKIEAHYQQTKECGYACCLNVRHGKRIVCQVQLNLSVSNGEARIKVFAPLALLARLIASGSARPD